jgi:hypothetical protein
VVFAGADLAFTNGRPYCHGNTYEEDWRRAAEWGTPLSEQWAHQIDTWPRTEQPDVNGDLTRTAPHLVAFRDWLVEQIGREPGVTFVNGTGRGILAGPRISQRPLAATAAAWPRLRVPARELVAARYRPVTNSRLLAAARALDGDEETLRTWIDFADGLTRDRILSQIARAARPVVCEVAAPARADGRFTLALDPSALEHIVAALPLVAMPIPPGRLAFGAASVRHFRFRTTVARVFCSAFQLPDGGILEDGRPLRRVAALDDIAPGQYVQFRDEISLMPSDGSDPRYNDRIYTVLVPEAVAFAEMLPLPDISARRV